jgi:O-antigen/teichoic acid export membrane protein
MMRKALVDSFIWRGVYFITALLLNVCIARIYEATTSGWIYFISNNFNLIILIGGLSLDSSMTYFSASKRIAPAKLALFSLSWPLAVTILSVGCTLFLINTGQITSDHLFLLVAAGAYTFGISLTNFFTALFYAENNFVMPNILMSIINVLVIIVIPLFTNGVTAFNKDQFLYIYFLQFVLQGVGLAVLFLVLYAPIKSLSYPNKKEYKELLTFALVALSANIAYYLIYRVDYLFVEAWCSAKALGNYIQVSKMGQLLLIIPTIISSAIYPQVAKGESGNVVKLIFMMFWVFALLYMFIIAGAYLFSHNLFTWLFGQTFDQMFIPFIILLPGLLFLSLHLIVAAYLGGKNKPHYNLISTGTGLVVVLAGNFLLIKKMGIAGAALVSSVGYTTAFIVSLFLFMKITGSGLKDLFTRETFRVRTYTSLFAKQTSTIN